MLRFNLRYFLLSVLLFIIEVLIALYVHDNFFRPFMGDVLVVILLYYLLRAFTHLSVIRAAWLVLSFSFLVEILQYFKFVDLIGLGHHKLARIVIGTSFSWWDLLCYFAGFVIIIVTEIYINREWEKNL